MKISIRRVRIPAIFALATALAVPLASPTQAAEPQPPKGAAQHQAPTTADVDKPEAVAPKYRPSLLGSDYKKSADTVFATSGDGTGFHLLVADEADGYGWKTAATLAEPGFDTDTWVGQACLTASGNRAAVAYAPRTFTNKPELMARGAFAAVVDLKTGKVIKLPFQASLAYFNPGCGSGEQAVFTQLSYEGDQKQQTRLISVDASTGEAGTPVAYAGQVTSAVPVKDGIVAAHGNKVVKAGAKGKLAEVTRTRQVPFEFTVDASDGLTYIDRTATRSSKKASTSFAQHLSADQLRAKEAEPVTIASGPLTDWDLASTAQGTVFVTGKAATKGKLPRTVKNPGGISKDASLSSHGHAAVTTAWADGKDTRIRPEEAATERTVRTKLRVLGAKKTVTLDARPGKNRIGGEKAEAQGKAASPALPQTTTQSTKPSIRDDSGLSAQSMRSQVVAAAADAPSEGTAERTCSVPRNDVNKQAFQPTPRQVEWAADQAVVGKLDLYRGANWKNTGTGNYTPQALFPPIVLAGDPNGKLDTEDGDNDRWHIPSQILLGITAQESNMWQATRFAVPGVTANSLVGNYYGVDYAPDGAQLDPWRINWADADCGYGITQVTDGMRLPGHGQSTLSPLAQEAVALDYTANIAAGAQILSKKWNETHQAGMTVNNGHPQWIENWFFALWAYNSGFYPTADSGGHSGVGWTNNPANPLWKANRVPFLQHALDASRDDYSHAAQPQHWPYQEKVIGWAARPISAMFAPGDMQAGYRPAWWNNVIYRATAKPPIDLFCDSSNSCDPGKIGDNDSNDPGQGACTLDSGDKDTNPHWLHCWWNKAVEWKDCDSGAQCGYQTHRFNTSFPEQPDANSYPPRCSSGLPANALIVDDLPNGATPAGSHDRSCGPVKSDGTFTFNFTEWNGTYPGKMDTHQIGAAYQNHFWFTHTRTPESHPSNADRMKVTGTWKLGQRITTHGGQAKVYAHIPDHGAQTSKAEYRIKHAHGTAVKAISQDANQSNKWVDLGAYRFNDSFPEVSLHNFNGGDGSKDIAYDAIAFVPGKYDGMPSIGFADPNKNAPQPGDITIPQDMTPDNVSSGDPDIPTRQNFSEPKYTHVLSCAAKPFGVGSSHKAWVNRTEGCIKGQFGFIKTVDGRTTGTATFDFQAELKLHADSVGWNTALKFKLAVATGEARTQPIQVTVNDFCSLGCNKSGPRTDSGNARWLFSAGDRHVYSMSQIWKWDESSSSDLLFPKWAMTGEIGGTRTAQPADITPGADAQIRCDSIVPQSYPGCVFDRYTPTYVMNSQKFPAAAAHAWLVQNKLPGHFGSRAHGKPLTYLGSNVRSSSDPTKKQSTVNREVICPSSWTRNRDATLSPELDEGTQPDTWSCDEFAFAASYDSAGMSGGYNPVNSGDECLQTYAKRGSNGTWSLLSDPRYPLPRWNEKCGRATISNNQNTQSMRPFGQFIVRNRLMDKDKYWLDLNGFNP
ncbi:golvesin C-terminal-like domain-containing protein [Streptomyces parvus]|uniref:golvesin C-terminal-like domain-containing protein n=1 Tax=Streptomyces parvus TaxID=66428 RepID=UPI00381F3958